MMLLEPSSQHGWSADGESQWTDQSFPEDLCDLLMLQQNDSDTQNDDRDVREEEELSDKLFTDEDDF